MKMISNLTGMVQDDKTNAPGGTDGGVANTQSQKGFSRTINVTKNAIIGRSTSGGAVQIPIVELWKLMETADDGLKVPMSPGTLPG